MWAIMISESYFCEDCVGYLISSIMLALKSTFFLNFTKVFCFPSCTVIERVGGACDLIKVCILSGPILTSK